MSGAPSLHHQSPEGERQVVLFDVIGERYDALFPEKGAQIAAGRWLCDRLRPLARVLDAGCGTGVPTARALVQAGHDVLGVDVSNTMLQAARRNVPGARFERMDMTSLDLPERSLDAVTAFFSLLMLSRESIAKTLGSFARFLRPGGYLLVAMVEGDFDSLELPFAGVTGRFSAYPQADFAALLEETGFDVLQSEGVTYRPTSPDLHPERQLFYYCQLRMC
ncbi:class I SAM-dependent DNA methyltransferase [Polyangium aurulentum]|uniref:class I SAM-dependent DNA methyltransferase n=1 Tax=Polyangium aurulentum TaxID=2567896 RepID=UPI00146D6928|nr:class I SAM-dependent methyltransferase [Polyangium aurulentum]UQA55326.1 class I SAM-dependent methyltransferase [Polyangium aurulentum]